MIFVIFGTQKQQFTRLINLIINSKELENEKIIIQCGNTSYDTSHMEMMKFISEEKLEQYMKEADYIISHGGVGSLLTSLKLGKKILAVPRLKKYGEHINDHQIEICQQLQEQKYLLMYDEDKPFDDWIKKLKNTTFLPYENDKQYLNILRQNI